MHLVTCASPQEPLETAPRSALVADPVDGGDEQWDGFWSEASDEYFVRCTKLDGATEWFRVEDDVVDPRLRGSDTRVLAIRHTHRGRVNVVVAQSPSGRRMLVGSAGRGPR